MKKIYFLILLFIFFINGCASLSETNKKQSNKKHSKYHILAVINGSNYQNAIESLIKKTYGKNNYINCSKPAKDIINCDLEYKKEYWVKKCNDLTNKMQHNFCQQDKKSLLRFETYFHTHNRYLLGDIRAAMIGRNKGCLILRQAGENCKIIHHIKEYYQEVREEYKNCLDRYNVCNNPKYRKYKIIVGYVKNKNGLIIVVKKVSNNPKYFFRNSTFGVNRNLINMITKGDNYIYSISEKYVALKDTKNNKIYLISLTKNKTNSIIFHKRLKSITENKLIELTN